MSTPPEVVSPQQVRKIGILLGDLGKFNVSVLKFLVLQMNTLQQTFEYEFLPVDHKDKFLQKLSYRSSVDREELSVNDKILCRSFMITVRRKTSVPFSLQSWL